ncbi:MAG: CotH kinase family protein, partial [Flavobacteriales bacterium]
RKSYSSEIGLRTHGGNSRRHPQKGMRLYARSEYGNKKFRHPFFKNQETQEFKRLVLKPMSASWNDSGMQDLIANQMALNPELNFIGLQNEPVVVYLNGVYWGVYLLQERLDEYFIEEHFDLEDDEFDLIGNWYGAVNTGSNTEWLQLYDFISTHELSEPDHFEYVSSLIDIDNFIDYQIFQSFIANQDWPANNMMCWKKHGAGNKWQWIFKDGDGGFQERELNFMNHSLSTSDEFWPTNAYTTLFLRKLIENPTFEDQFYTRLTHLINNFWRYQDMGPLYDKAMIDFHDEIIEQNLRFPVIADYSEWLSAIDQVNHFMQVRACNLQSQLSEDLNKTITVPECYLPETDVDQLEVYPNPSDGAFYIYFESTLSKNLLIRIKNSQGQLIEDIPFPASHGENRVGLSQLGLPPGLYIIEVKADQHSEVCKLIISG